MGALTGKTLRPVKSGCGWTKNDTARAQELAQIDQWLAAYGLDSQGDTVTGVLSAQQDPNHLGTSPRFTGGGTISGGALLETVLGSGGRIKLGNNDLVTYSPPTRTRTVRYSFLEICRSYPSWNGGTPGTPPGLLSFGCAPTVYAPNGSPYPIGIQQSGDATSGRGQFFLPIPKPHNAATISTIKAWFFVPGQPSALPGMPTLFAGTASMSSGVVSGLATTETTFPTPSSTLAWYNGGKPQSFALTCTQFNVMSLATNTYFVLVQDAEPSGSTEMPRPVWTAVDIGYTAIGAEGFPQ